MNISWDKKVLAGIFTIVAGGLLLAFTHIDRLIGMSIINAGSIIAITSYGYALRKEKVIHDERTKMVSAKAASYSWMITVILLGMLIWLLEYGIISVSSKVLIGIVFAEMSITMLVSKWWLDRRGVS